MAGVKGKPLQWSNEEIAKVIRRIYEKHGRITSELLGKEAPGARNALYRRVRKGEFPDTKTAIEEVRKENYPIGSAQIGYQLNDLGENEAWIEDKNPRGGVFGKIGKIVGTGDGELRVSFKEEGSLIRVYRDGFNLDHIIPLNEKAKKLIDLQKVSTC